MVSMASSEVYRIGSVTYDSSTRTLTHDNGQTEYFTPRVSDVFLLLLAHQGKCVAKEFLLSQCWGDTIVSEQALTNVISKLRKVLANHALDMITITTVSKSGYLLEVKEENLRSRNDFFIIRRRIFPVKAQTFLKNLQNFSSLILPRNIRD